MTLSSIRTEFSKNKYSKYSRSFWLLGIAFFSGFILSVLSWLELCVEHCSANQEYRIFQLPFAFVGIAFFAAALALLFASERHAALKPLISWMVSGALGAEFLFIQVQKNQIGHWCPVCLSIAASVALAALILSADFFLSLPKLFDPLTRGEIMPKTKPALSCLSFVILGFVTALFGVSKPDFAQAAANEMKERLAFGTKNSPVEVYFVSDWFCPSCKKIEPLIEKLYPQIKSQVTFYFIDYPIHKKSLNFSPYNLSFLLNDKPQYFKARELLLKLTGETESPTDEEVEKIAKKAGIVFKELSYLEIKAGLDYFEKIVDQYHLKSTPTLIVVNTRKNNTVQLEGRDEITEKKVLEAIKKLSALK